MKHASVIAMRATGVALVALLAPFAPAAAQVLTDLQPGRNFVGAANFGTGRSENIDVGDADNDGDLDVLVANGGDGPAQQNRIYINDGVANFVDETALRFAGVTIDTSRDIEFVDHDNDGDLDVHVANRGTVANGGEVSRFYVNLGGLQAGTVGFFNEDSDARWGDLLSVPLGDQVFGGNAGPWRDYSCDCDFADLDDDGDLDLFHSSYGPNQDGSRPSRIFLNDGTGVYDELFPWANPTADIQMHGSDLDLVDFDGDFDIDIFNSSRSSQARVFMNTLYGPGGATPFRDITQSALIDTGATKTGFNNYECEPGDVDGDGDFDVWLVNYDGNFDRVLRNDGPTATGFKFTKINAWIVGDPNTDEYEADFGDFDGDGDLDVFIANFSGTNALYMSGLAQGMSPATQGLHHRTGGGASSLAAAFPEMPTTGGGSTSLDGEWGDLDGDGDLDILVANDTNQQNWMYRNDLGIPDTHAPTFAPVESIVAPPAGQPVVVHAAVRDGVPYYLFMFYDVELHYAVDGGAVRSVAMFAQGGQQFRGVIPAQSGVVDYWVTATDLAGNTGISAPQTYAQGGGVLPFTDLGHALAGAHGPPVLAGSGALLTGSAGALTLTNAAGPGAVAILFTSLSSTPTPFKGGTLLPVPIALQLTLSTGGSPGSIPLGWSSWPAGLSGASLYFQYAIADALAVQGVALSNALRADVP